MAETLNFSDNKGTRYVRRHVFFLGPTVGFH